MLQNHVEIGQSQKFRQTIYTQRMFLVHIKYMRCQLSIGIYLEEWAIASHGMYKSTLFFIQFKIEYLYIVAVVKCDFWDIMAYLLLPELNTTMKMKKKVTTGNNKVRIRFWNYFSGRSHPSPGHNRIFPADRIGILLWKQINYCCTFSYWQ